MSLRWVRLSKYCADSGETRAQIWNRLRTGVWRKGTHANTPDGSNELWVNLDAIDAWRADDSSQPVSRPTQLYRHFDAAGQLLYVGVSLSVFHRHVAHRNSSRWADRIVTITIEYFSSREAAFAAESEAIAIERPLFNIAKVPRPAQAEIVP